MGVSLDIWEGDRKLELTSRWEALGVTKANTTGIDDKPHIGTHSESLPLGPEVTMQRLSAAGDELAQQIGAVHGRVDTKGGILESQLDALGDLIPAQDPVPGNARLGLEALRRLLAVLGRRRLEVLDAEGARDAAPRLRRQLAAELGDGLLEPPGLALELGRRGWDGPHVSACPHGGVVGRVRDRGAGDGRWPFARDEEHLDAAALLGLRQERLEAEGAGEANDAGAARVR